MNKLLLICFSFSLISNAVCQSKGMVEEAGWEYVKSKHDVDIYSKEIDGYSIKAFKATGLIAAPYQTVTNAVMDIENYVTWYPDCNAGVLLDEPDEWTQYRRIAFKLPWPLDNRDVVNKLLLTTNENEAYIEVIDAADYTPEIKNTYRVKRTEGFWTIKKENENLTRVTYAAIGEPGGVPAWIANIFLFDTPLEAINNLREVVKDKKYSVR